MCKQSVVVKYSRSSSGHYHLHDHYHDPKQSPFLFFLFYCFDCLFEMSILMSFQTLIHESGRRRMFLCRSKFKRPVNFADSIPKLISRLGQSSHFLYVLFLLNEGDNKSTKKKDVNAYTYIQSRNDGLRRPVTGLAFCDA